MKKILILLMIFIITGCSINYEININQDNTLDEAIYFTEKKDVLTKYGTSISNAVSNVKEFFLSGENNIEPEIILNNKTTFKNNDEDSISYKLNKNFDNVDDYSKSLFFNYYFETSKVNSNNGTYIIYGSKFNYENVKKLTTSYKYTFNLDNIIIKIHSDYVVTETNATGIDKKNNDYYWTVNEENASNFELKLTYSKNNKFIYSETEKSNVVEKIAGNIINKISLGKVNGEQFIKNNKLLPILFVGIILVFVLLLIFIIRKKINHTNKI